MRAPLILLLVASPCLAQYTTRSSPPTSIDVYVHDADRARDRAKIDTSTPSYFEKALEAQRAKVEADRNRADSLRPLQLKSWERAKEMYPALKDATSLFRRQFDEQLRKARARGNSPELMKDYPEFYANLTATLGGWAVAKHPDALP